MDRKEYLRDPCGTLSIPYWKARTLPVPDTVRIVHGRDWHGQYADPRRFFRVKHGLKDLPPADFDYDTIAVDLQTRELAEMIRASYRHAGISVGEEDILRWKEHETFREDLWVYICAPGGIMAASGIAEYDEACREGSIEWVQVLPEYRRKGLGRKIVTVLLNRLRNMGADFATVSGDLDDPCRPLELYRACGFEGDDIWYVCRTAGTQPGGIHP